MGRIDYVIAADGGARYCNLLGLTPQLVIGDFDTLTQKELARIAAQGIETERFPANKDYADTHLALLRAIEKGYADIIIVAALGGRFDHTLANVMLLALPEAEKINLRILGDQQEIFLVRKEKVWSGRLGTLVSLLPLSEKVTGIKTEGLVYKVPHGTFVMGVPNGISNVMTGSEARVQIESGLLLVVIDRTGSDSEHA